MQNVLIVGAGLSGRGMLGELYDKAGYNITFADIDSQLVKGLKKQGYYTVKMTDIKSGQSKNRIISNFKIIDVNHEHQKYIRQLATTKYISSALMPEDFSLFSKNIAEAMIYRKEHHIDSISYITLGANYVGLRQIVTKKVETYLANDSLQLEENNVYLLMSIVNRKNLLPEDNEKTKDVYRIVGDNKPVLRVDNLSHLSKEKDIPPFFVLESKLDAAMAVKIWTGNVVQCSMAFVALSKGMKYTDEAAYDKQSAMYAYYASNEAYAGVEKEYNLPPRSIKAAKDTVDIFKSEDFRDSLYRITREPLRKLKRNDRFIGPALCSLKHGILPFFITKCLAYAFIYTNKKEPDTLKIQEKVQKYGIDKSITELCELNLVQKDERIVHDLILNHYRSLLINF